MLSLGLTAQAQWYTGMSQKTGLALCIHLTDSAAELYSPMQTQEPMPVSEWSLEGDKLTIECKKLGFKTVVTRHNDAWQGYWKQGLFKEDITFLPTDTIFSLCRPQTPQPPYRFDEETVTADYTDSQGNPVHLEGTLSVPRGTATRYPCLVLVSGSGQQNRDEEIMQHKPFLVLADYLASRGIVVLRYDDRGVGASSGDAGHGTTALFSEDAEAMFNVLKGNPHVNPNRLGIGGHSEGGAIAPMVAARNKDVKFVVMLAGQGCTGLDVLMQQNDAIFRANGLSDSLLSLRNNCMRELFSMPAGSSQKDYKKVIDRYTAGLTKEQVDSIGLGRGAAATFKQQMDMPWMRSFLTLDPAEYLPKVICPVLAL
ncbi:MAG: alpha/beta hydrolase, partial [Bacteroidaceae bacterium]|nr:alpha/beta hydrolase [Bacteroidaceae bacterium]